MTSRRTLASRGDGYSFTSLTYGRRIILFFCVLLLMLVLAGFSSQLAAQLYVAGSREYFIAVSVLQNLISFCGTAFVVSVFLTTRPLAMLGLNRTGTWRAVGGVLLIMAVGIPLLNQVTWWNSQMHFPSFMHSIEAMMRAWESGAAHTTEVMLSATSVGALLVNILVVGIFTGFSEELVFRGAMQRIIGSGHAVGGHTAVWITAVIFSFMHFQFFGFLPRVLLGAFFGYLFLWTGSIYISATAHALNNSLYVLLHWLALRGYTTGSIDDFGVSTHGFPALACVSLALVLFIMVGMRSYLFTTRKV